jgi:hypothetical protein
MDCGFEIFSSKFICSKLLDPRVIRLYIDNDQKYKRFDTITDKKFEGYIKFIEGWMRQRKHKRELIMVQYCNLDEGGIKAPLKHYLDNKINKHMLVWLISQKYLKLTDDERRLIPWVLHNYWSYSKEIIEMFGGRMYEYKDKD